MVGKINLSYSDNDIIKLIKHDIVHKFGQRDLTGVDLSIPEIYDKEALVTQYPEPEVVITSIEDQVAELGLPSLPIVPRAAASVGQDKEKTGGEDLQYDFDRLSNTLTITGGPIKWSSPVTLVSQAGHWAGVFINFPLGISYTADTILPLMLNSRPTYIKLTETDITNGGITVYFNGIYTENHVVINWDADYEPEEISVIITATLEDTAYKKYPMLPSEPKVSFRYPEATQFCPAKIKVDVDLSLGSTTCTCTFAR